MEYVLPLKFIAGLFVNKHEIKYTKETLVCDCIDFLDDIQDRYWKYVKNDDLITACRIGNRYLVEYLIEYGADIHANDDRALCWASWNGHLNIVKLLIECGADVHARDDEALREASVRGPLKLVKLLIDNGADIHANNDIALCKASEFGNLEIVKFLIECGADIHAENDCALHWAYSNDQTNVFNYLKSIKEN